MGDFDLKLVVARTTELRRVIKYPRLLCTATKSQQLNQPKRECRIL